MATWASGMLALVFFAAISGCADEVRNEPAREPKTDVRAVGGLDPRPELQDGSESAEFEAGDLETAAGAGLLVDLYCDGVESEAQYQGCLSHVTEADVCEADTDSKLDAIDEYALRIGDEPC